MDHLKHKKKLQSNQKTIQVLTIVSIIIYILLNNPNFDLGFWGPVITYLYNEKILDFQFSFGKALKEPCQR